MNARGAPLHLRFFLSSPGDVSEERRRAYALIKALEGQPAFRGKITTEVIAYDDPAAPAPMSATETPQASVNRYAGRPSDCDLTIVILWSRLGTALPDDVVRADGSRYASGTVWELEDAQQGGCEVWLYRRNETPKVALDDAAFEVKRAAYLAVDTFFNSFTNPDGSLARGFSTYAGPPELDALLELHLEQFVRSRLDLAQKSADAGGPSRGADRASGPSWSWPRAWDFAAYIAERRQGFVGREWLFDKVRAWHQSTDAAQALLIVADFGVGKSAIMAELASGERGVPVIASHFCHNDTHETLAPATFVRSVAAQFARALPGYKAAVEAEPEIRDWLDRAQADPASAFERAVIAPLHALEAPAAPLLLLVDAIDEALEFRPASDGPRAGTIVALLAKRIQRLPAWLRIVVTTRRRQEVLQPLQQPFRAEALDAEDSHNLDDMRRYAALRCAGAKLAAVLAKANVSASAVADTLATAAQSSGKFLYAVRVLNDLESGALSPARLEALPPGMDGFYLDTFERRFAGEHDYATVRPLLGVLCAQREPLARTELAAVLETDESRVRAELGRLEDLLVARSKRYALDHVSLSQWLTEETEAGYPRAGRFAVDRNGADALLTAWARRELATERAHASAYLARHLPAHLGAGERRASGAKLLLDLNWLDARLRAAGLDALLADLAELDPTPMHSALERALHHGSHVLAHDDEAWHGADLLAQQLLGRLQRRAEAELQRLCTQAESWIRQRGGLRPLTASLETTQALLRTLVGHTGTVQALALLHDGRLASASYDKTIRLWNLSTGACEATLAGHTAIVTALAVLLDGRIASASWDDTIRLWDPRTGRCVATFAGHSQYVSSLAVLADGRLASGTGNHDIAIWDLTEGVCTTTFGGHTDWVRALVVLADGRLASSADDRTIKLWNQTTGDCEVTLEGHESEVQALAPLADGRLASGARDGTIKLWNTRTQACEATFAGHTHWIYALAATADGRLASGASDGTIKLWNLDSLRCETTYDGQVAVHALAVLADGRFASGAFDGTVRIWNPRFEDDASPIEERLGVTPALAALADGRLAVGFSDYSIRLWDPRSQRYEAVLRGHASGVETLIALPDGRIASGSRDQTIRVWDPHGEACGTVLQVLHGGVYALAVLHDGRLASGSSDETIGLLNLSTGACEATLAGETGWIYALAAWSDGRLASASTDTAIRIWKTDSGACEAPLTDHTGWVYTFAVLADGRLASGSGDHTIRLWNAQTLLCEAVLTGHEGQVRTLALLPDGRLASGSVDHSVRFWQFEGGHWRATTPFVADAPIDALAFLPQAAILAVGDASGRLHLLKAESPPAPKPRDR